MCGIAGLLDLSGAPADRGVLLRMLRRIEHRGPDGGGWMEDDAVSISEGPRNSGFPRRTRSSPGLNQPGSLKVSLGHQRLSITDLSDAGRQPMERGGGRWWIVFNGAIYNAPELRAELRAEGEKFSSSTDTEVLLASYVRWGAGALPRLDGMWAFAIWDAERRELFCARDRFAIKPFYYTTAGSLFAFASEPKALRPASPAEPDLAFARGFLAGGVTADGVDVTCYANYRCLPPGNMLRIGREGLRIEPWYDLDTAALRLDVPGSIPEASEQLRELLTNSVEARLRADVPIGLLLSGGVDSAGIAGILGRIGKRGSFTGRTLSTRYPDLPDIDESFFVGEVLRATGLSGEFLEPSAEELDRELDRMVETVDALIPASIFYAQWVLGRASRQRGLPVMLGGQGSDELFGGYEPGDLFSKQLWNRGNRGAAIREGFLSGRRRWGALRGGRHAMGTLRKARAPLPCRCSIGGTLQQHQRHLLCVDYLPGILAFEDRELMASGIETRLPFLDHQVVEFARRLPDAFLFRDGWTKIVLRTALAGMVPDSVLWKPRKLGLPGPVESHSRNVELPLRGADRRLVEGGWTESLGPEESLRDPRLRLRIRVLDAWTRRCLGGDS
ncbi:MAG: asparagine synthase (glutamine-hydrolyzing) [Thermoanaerobaculia bacterium]